MLGFGSLWWVVLLAAVAVFVVSSVAHMVLKYHWSDHGPLPDEDGARAALGGDLPPGQYRVPHCASMEAMKGEEFERKMNEGPVVSLVVTPRGPYPMGKALALWFAYALFSSFVVAYVARHAGLGAGAEFMEVLRITGAVAWGIHALPALVPSIWMGQPWSVAVKTILDGTAYALATGLVFAGFWPGA
jgi:hypothetical protein